MGTSPHIQLKTLNTRLVATEKAWIESDAVRQLEHAACMPGIDLAVGYPDLHPGKGHPIGGFIFRTVCWSFCGFTMRMKR